MIRSWLFLGGGGLGEAVWTREGKEWRVDSSGSSADGGEFTATNIYSPPGQRVVYLPVDQSFSGRRRAGRHCSRHCEASQAERKKGDRLMQWHKYGATVLAAILCCGVSPESLAQRAAVGGRRSAAAVGPRGAAVTRSSGGARGRALRGRSRRLTNHRNIRAKWFRCSVQSRRRSIRAKWFRCGVQSRRRGRGTARCGGWWKPWRHLHDESWRNGFLRRSRWRCFRTPRTKCGWWRERSSSRNIRRPDILQGLAWRRSRGPPRRRLRRSQRECRDRTIRQCRRCASRRSCRPALT